MLELDGWNGVRRLVAGTSPRRPDQLGPPADQLPAAPASPELGSTMSRLGCRKYRNEEVSAGLRRRPTVGNIIGATLEAAARECVVARATIPKR